MMRNFPRLLWYLSRSLRRLNWDKKKLGEYQEKKLREIVRYAFYNVPFYHDYFKRVGINVNDVKTLEDLSKLPIIRKEDLRQAEPNRIVSKEFAIDRLKMVRTSGSTGQPFRVFLSRGEDDWRKAIYMRANISCGQRARDRWVVITSPHHFGDTSGIQHLLRLFDQECISVFTKIREQVRLVNEANPDILDGYSGSLLLLAKEVKQLGLNTIRPRIIFGTADLIDNQSRGLIERVFDAPFYDQFGCAELDRTAWQCPERKGYHMDADSVITQFVDDEGNDVSLGESGEVVYTSLFNYVQPLIRYGVRDVGKPLSDQCPCGRKLPLMEVVEGRRDSFLVFPNGRVLSPMGFWSIMRLFDLAEHIDQFVVTQRKPDLVEISVKRKDNTVEESLLGQKLVEHIENCIGIERSICAFHVSFVDKILLSKGGKLQSVISLVPFQQEEQK